MQINRIENYFFLFLILIIGCNQYPPNYKKMEKLVEINHINDFKWINRVLIIKNQNQKKLFTQMKANENKLFERDIITIVIIDENAYIENNILPYNFYKSLKNKLSKIDNVYETILIGRDGKIKKTYKIDIDLNVIFSDIDKMPMRINEMKNKY